MANCELKNSEIMKLVESVGENSLHKYFKAKCIAKALGALSSKQLADELGCPQHKVYTLVRLGKIPAPSLIIGKIRYFRDNEVKQAKANLGVLGWFDSNKYATVIK